VPCTAGLVRTEGNASQVYCFHCATVLYSPPWISRKRRQLSRDRVAIAAVSPANFARSDSSWPGFARRSRSAGCPSLANTVSVSRSAHHEKNLDDLADVVRGPSITAMARTPVQPITPRQFHPLLQNTLIADSGVPARVARIRHHWLRHRNILHDQGVVSFSSRVGGTGNEARARTPAPLRGLMRCTHCSSAMTPTHTRRRGRLYRY
jgi:hypothetical protein